MAKTIFSFPRREYVLAGFFVAFGACLLAVLAVVALHLGAAVLAIATPFVIGTVVTLLLDPTVHRLQRAGLSRLAGVSIVFVVFLVVTTAALTVSIPILVHQATHFAQDAPTYMTTLKQDYAAFVAKPQHKKIAGYKLPKSLDALLDQVSDQATAALQRSAGGLTDYVVGSVTTVLELVVSLIVTFYLLMDFDRLRARLFFLVPKRARGPLQQIGSDIGGVFSDYLRGLLIVCALYGLVVTILLYSLAIKQHALAQYGLLVGVAAGILYAVPYIGAIVTAVLTFVAAFAAGGFGFGALAVILLLVINQIFDNVVTPRVVGGGVGLHPVVALFALSLGGQLFGLPGLLLSVPAAASVQVILFHVFPKLTLPTPREFLRYEGVRRDDVKSAKILEGDQPEVHEKEGQPPASV